MGLGIPIPPPPATPTLHQVAVAGNSTSYGLQCHGLNLDGSTMVNCGAATVGNLIVTGASTFGSANTNNFNSGTLTQVAGISFVSGNITMVTGQISGVQVITANVVSCSLLSSASSWAGERCGYLKFLGSSSNPTNAEGTIYYNNSTKHWLGYNGTAWVQLDN